MKATAVATSNIAFIKFFGKSDEKLRIPTNDSLSMNLSGCTTTTTVEFSDRYDKDEITLSSEGFFQTEENRVLHHLNYIRSWAKVTQFAKIVTKNSFPKSTGVASSASGFAALTLAAVSALGKKVSEKELSTLARMASGSACRSIPEGFVRWFAGSDHASSYAQSIYPSDYWDIRDLLIIVTRDPKTVSTSDAHKLSKQSPFFLSRLTYLKTALSDVLKALSEKNFKKFGELIEYEAFNMHAVMATCRPPILYLLPQTIAVIRKVWELRESGVQVYVTLDAGPNVHIIYEGKNSAAVLKILTKNINPLDRIENKPGAGTTQSVTHLF